jgi:putative endonuclease
MPTSPTSAHRSGRRAERRARLHYRLRGYRVLGSNVWAGGYELDLVLRRGRRLVFCEVKAKSGPGYGDPLEMITAEKLRRLWSAGDSWLAAHPESAGLEVAYEAVGLHEGRLQRVPLVP